MNKMTLIAIGLTGGLIITLIALGLVAFILSDLFFSKKRQKNDIKAITELELIENDKVILITQSSAEDVQKSIIQFCKLYNQETLRALPQLHIFEDYQLITFPYDISFDDFCYFINYMEYPEGFEDYHIEITGWCTTKIDDIWMTNEIVDKKVMIYIPDWDKEYDNVYLTTQDNLGFKMGFAIGESHIKLDKAVNDFSEISIDLNQKPLKVLNFQ